jgi:peptidoglycan/LPS O-acetylase OafA/YrhL
MNSLPLAAGPAARVAPLDAVRGLAALTVVLHHAWLLGTIVPGPGARWAWRLARYSPLDIIIEGRFPVILFFVLSGFVLTRALERPGGQSGFVPRRVLRIWLPFAATLLLSMALCAALRTDAPAWSSDWFVALWSEGAADPGSLPWRLAIPAARREDLDPVVWSLAHELRISLLFPLLLAAARRHFRLTLAAALAVHLAVLAALPGFAVDGECSAILRCRPVWGGSVAGSLALTLYFVLPFVAGIGIALAPPGRFRVGAGTVLVALWAMNGAVVSSDLLFTAGAAVVVVYAAGVRGGVLTWRGPLWLGRVSYSLYLVHAVVFLALAHALAGAMPPGVLAALAVPASLVAAALFFRAVEAPSVRLARRIGLRGEPAFRLERETRA